MPVSFDQNCLHLTFKPYLSSDSYSRKYKKLQNSVTTKNVKLLQKKLLKLCDLQIRLCFFMFQPIMLKQINSLTLIHSFVLVSRGIASDLVREDLGSIPGSGKDFYVCYFILLFLFYFCVLTHYLS